jgi:DNA replication protein DnaC
MGHASRSTSTTSNGNSQRPKLKRDDEDPPGFAAFWGEYPNKAAKKAARRAWIKHKLHEDETLRQQIMAALAVQKRSQNWTKENGAFVPYAATWLNDERWTDELRPQNGHHDRRHITDDWDRYKAEHPGLKSGDTIRLPRAGAAR